MNGMNADEEDALQTPIKKTTDQIIPL